MELVAHPGPQTNFLSCTADIAVYGGAAGGGKTYALLLEPLRNTHNPNFGAVIFRRTSPQIRREGGLWDESNKLYRPLGAHGRESILDWTWPSGSKVAFAAMEHETDRFDWDGSQIPLIGFDQLEHFTEKQFFYMLSRNRSTCGVAPYIRATANPDPDSFLVEFLKWWIDGDTGYPVTDRAGIIRYMIRSGDDIVWGENPQSLKEEYGDSSIDYDDIEPLSVTFIPAKLEDNPTLIKNDPSYRAKIRALPRVERERLEKGNWKVRPSAGYYFKRTNFMMVDSVPPRSEIKQSVRWWDLASTEVQLERTDNRRRNKNPDYTVGTKMHELKSGRWCIEHVRRLRADPFGVERAMLEEAEYDTPLTTIGLSQDPGQAGISQVEAIARFLKGYHVKSQRETGDKETRAKPFSAQVQHNNVSMVRGPWNEPFFDELENFPDSAFDDQVDSSSMAFNHLSGSLKAGTWGQ